MVGGSVTFVANDGDEQAKGRKIKKVKVSERALVSLLSHHSLSEIDYIWRRNPCMEAKIKEREVKE